MGRGDAPPSPQPRRFDEDYRLERPILGRGAAGVVAAARCLRSGQHVAVKTLCLAGLDEAARRRAAREAEVALALDHPHVIKVLGVYEADTELRLVMEQMHGGDLQGRFLERGALGEREAADVARQVLLALAHAHARGVVHRDVRLGKFLFQHHGGSTLKLIDFGHGRFFQPGERMATRVGSPLYAAPEVTARRYYSGSCDTWSVGMVVFALLHGRLPFGDAGAAAGRCETLPGQWDALSNKAQDFVARLLDADPARRPTAKAALSHPWLAAGAGAATAAARDVSRALVSFAEASLHRQACLRWLAGRRALPANHRLLEIFGMLDTDHAGTVDLADVRQLLASTRRLRGATSLPGEGDALRFVSLVLRPEGVAPAAAEGEGRISYSDFLALMSAAQFDADDDEELTLRIFDCFEVGGFAAGLDPELPPLQRKTSDDSTEASECGPAPATVWFSSQSFLEDPSGDMAKRRSSPGLRKDGERRRSVALRLLLALWSAFFPCGGEPLRRLARRSGRAVTSGLSV